MKLADQYRELRRQGELLVGSALDRVSMSPEDERELLSHELILVAADAERAIDGDEGAEERTEAAMKSFLRHLKNRRDRRNGMRMLADADGQVEAAQELLAEIRTARRRMIEALREEISKSGDIEAAKECCRLLEEEIGAARASKDIESERIATASLEVVRRLAEPEEVDREEIEYATALAQTLITNGDIAAVDGKWAVKTLRELVSASTAPDPEEDALRKTLIEYRDKNREKPRSIRDIDPHAHLVGTAI